MRNPLYYITVGKINSKYFYVYFASEASNRRRPYFRCRRPYLRCWRPYFRYRRPYFRCRRPYFWCRRPYFRCRRPYFRCWRPYFKYQMPHFRCRRPYFRCRRPYFRYRTSKMNKTSKVSLIFLPNCLMANNYYTSCNYSSKELCRSGSVYCLILAAAAACFFFFVRCHLSTVFPGWITVCM